MGLQIVTPLLKSSSGRHPVVLRYYDDYGNIIKNNHSISARIRVNGAIIEPSIALNKGVGSYILDLDGSMNDVSISAYIEEYEETNESIISAIPAANSTALSGSLPPGETVWVSNSKILINTDLYVPNGSIFGNTGGFTDMYGSVCKYYHKWTNGNKRYKKQSCVIFLCRR